jgi:flagellar biogenesis protein FliO
MPAALTFFFAFLAVLLLIGGVAWLIRRFAGNRLGTNTNRGRMPRLAVIDAAAVDGRRRLVLVRRDNIEHLLMIGGPTDIVVEPNIVRGVSGREQPRPAVAGPDAQQPRIALLPDAGWNEPDALRAESLEPELPMPEPAPRPARPAFAEETRRPPRSEQRNDRIDRNDPLTGFNAESISAGPIGGGRSEPRPEPMMPPRLPRSEPTMPRSTPRPIDPPKPPPPLRAERPTLPAPPPPLPPSVAPTTGPATSSADQNLAEMAQRLEAALRRPSTTPDPIAAPPVAPEPPAARPTPRSEPVAAPSPPAAPIKTGFENLEDEMASLLGRPKTPS